MSLVFASKPKSCVTSRGFFGRIRLFNASQPGSRSNDSDFIPPASGAVSAA
jgi:hypothetical protein